MVETALFIAGFILVVKGADLLIDGAVFIADRLHVSQMAIGLTIVALGTSLPELFVNVSASFRQASDLAIGNVLGSNIANILLVLGVAALISPLPIKKGSLTVDAPFSIFAALLMVLLANTALMSAGKEMLLDKPEGILMLIIFAIYIVYIALNAKKKVDVLPAVDSKKLGIPLSLIYILIGIAGLYFGGQWIVNGALFLSGILGLSESFIGLSAIAIGTTVPELVTSVVAAKKGNVDIAVGNVIGSNIFNLLWVLPVSALINPIAYNQAYNVDVLLILVASLFMIGIAVAGKKRTVGKGGGVMFLMLYGAYLVYIYWRG